MITLLLMMAPTCGDDGSGFGSGGSSSPGGSADNACNADNADNAGGADSASDDTGESNGTGDVFVDVSASCSGDNTEWTWTLTATLSSGASALWVEVDPNTPDYDKWDLSKTDNGGKEWSAEVTELYTSTDCEGEKSLEWHAMVGGNNLETTTTTYSP
ncbi:MAG: hypothetical protein GY913_24235 [Proteobacteria bacterium]|nr:hypothetical protein [Pseudomonadota bacterium]MCP4920024.1 hypothetical protein [Pseudomonadota bacterium]